ncbi:CWF19-like protein 2 isoform X2 [Zophobas morio]|uniref:CWF19-like protein 2 isoform X2 n=1 Tax=Zophobas morio TaxID=2755281 RepID=UPI00308322E7
MERTVNSPVLKRLSFKSSSGESLTPETNKKPRIDLSDKKVSKSKKKPVKSKKRKKEKEKRKKPLEHQEVSSKRDTFELSNSNFDTEAEGEVRQLPLVKERQEWMLDSMPPPRRGCLPFTSNRNPEEFGPQTIEHYTFGGASAEEEPSINSTFEPDRFNITDRLMNSLNENNQKLDSPPDISSLQSHNTEIASESPRDSEKHLNFSSLNLNQLNALLIKAEMQQDTSSVNKLRQQIDEVKKINNHLNASYYSNPPTTSVNAAENESLSNLVKQEKIKNGYDYDGELVYNVGNINDSYDCDVFISMQKKHLLKRAISDYKKTEKIIDGKCKFCCCGSNFPHHSVISFGIHFYLCVPNHVGLVSGHCLLVPVDHVPAVRDLDSLAQNELRIWKKYITKAFVSQEQLPIFFETAINLKYKRHAFIEVIPLPNNEIGSQASIYFQKALQEAGSDWAQHRKLLKTSPNFPVRSAIPSGFPYFHVEFASGSGFARVIDTEKKFSVFFGSSRWPLGFDSELVEASAIANICRTEFESY